MNPAPEYFKFAVAWRSAFFAMLEYENPIELRCRAVENKDGWIYRSPSPHDKYHHTSRKYKTPKFP